MAKIKYNVKGVDSGSSMELIPKGTYRCRIKQCLDAKPQGKDRRLEMQYEIMDGKFKGRVLFDYINLEADTVAWKFRQLLEAVGLVTDKKETGTLDTDKVEGTTVMVLVRHQAGQAGTQWEGETQARVGSVLPAEEAEAEDDEEDLDEDEESDDEDDEDEVDLDELDRKELKQFIKDNELDITVKKAHSDDDIRTAIAAAMGEDDEEDEESDDEEEDDDSGEMPDYDSMDAEELRSTCKERGLSTKGSKKILVARLTKDDESDEDPF